MQHWIVSDIEALKYWLDLKAIQVPKYQVELFSVLNSHSIYSISAFWLQTQSFNLWKF